MKKTAIISLVATLLTWGLISTSCKSQQPTGELNSTIPTSMGGSSSRHDDPNRLLIVMYNDAVGCEPLMKAASDYGAQVVDHLSNVKCVIIRIPDDKETWEAMRYFRVVEGVQGVERNRKVNLH